MYSRKISGYAPSVPPPGYNGVAFNRRYQPSSEIAPIQPAPAEVLPEQDAADAAGLEETFDENNEAEEPSELCETPESESKAESDSDAEKKQDILSDIASKELKIEDLLLIGAVLLFVSGELDGDIMLLLGLLLVAGI